MHFSMPRREMEPFYFGTSAKPLFGCYHAPQSERTRECGVVLCYPMENEYIISHRAYRQLAVRLSNVGFPVLRFDFYGCGDSGGDFEQAQIRQWLTDISTAIDEMIGRCNLGKVCLVGLRLGGSLAAMVGGERSDIDGIVLWDPVVSGRAYIEELTTLHREMLRYSYAKPRRGMADEKHTERPEFPITGSMLSDLEKIDLLAIRQKPANNILIVQSNEGPGEGRFREHLESIGAHLEYKPFPSAKIWKKDPHRPLVPNQIVQSVVYWISEIYP